MVTLLRRVLETVAKLIRPKNRLIRINLVAGSIHFEVVRCIFENVEFKFWSPTTFLDFYISSDGLKRFFTTPLIT